MNFDICKKCLGYSIKNKIKGGFIYAYDRYSTTIGFYLKNRKHENVKVKLKTPLYIQKLLFANSDAYNEKTFQKLNLENILINIEIISCSYANNKGNWQSESKPCLYCIEHQISEWNEK